MTPAEMKQVLEALEIGEFYAVISTGSDDDENTIRAAITLLRTALAGGVAPHEGGQG